MKIRTYKTESGAWRAELKGLRVATQHQSRQLALDMLWEEIRNIVKSKIDEEKRRLK